MDILHIHIFPSSSPNIRVRTMRKDQSHEYGGICDAYDSGQNLMGAALEGKTVSFPYDEKVIRQLISGTDKEVHVTAQDKKYFDLIFGKGNYTLGMAIRGRPLLARMKKHESPEGGRYRQPLGMKPAQEPTDNPQVSVVPSSEIKTPKSWRQEVNGNTTTFIPEY